jgi:hypothetical protein
MLASKEALWFLAYPERESYSVSKAAPQSND